MQGKLHSIINSLTRVNRDTPLPAHDSIAQLANDFGNFFISKIEDIHKEIDSQEAPFPNLSSFAVLTEDDVRKLVMGSKTTSCELDPIPTDLIKENIEILLPVLTKMITISLQCHLLLS